MWKDVLIIAVLVLACTTNIITIGNTAETKPTDHCIFCDTWLPYSSSGTTFASDDVLIITRDSLALPGCSQAKVRVVQQGFGKDDFDDPRRPLPVYILYELTEDPKCKRAMPLANTGSLVEV